LIKRDFKILSCEKKPFRLDDIYKIRN